MKKLILLSIILFGQMSAFANCNLSGKFKITGDWTSFSEWYISLENGNLVDSYTDDLPAKDFPTFMNVDGNYLNLTQTTYASDAIIDVILHLKATCVNGVLELQPLYGYEVYLDETSDDAHDMIMTKDLAAASN